MSLNPDPSKQAVEVYFSRRIAPANSPVLSFNQMAITGESHKHLGLIPDKKLIDHHLLEKIQRLTKVLVLLINLYLPRDSLVTI